MSKRRRVVRARSGEGSVYERADGKWIAEISLGGRGTGRRRPRRICDDESSAWNALRKLRAEAPQALFEDAGITLETYMTRHFEVHVAPTVREKTLYTYQSICRTHVYPALGRRRIDQLQATHLQAFFADLAKAGVGARLREVVHQRLKAALALAVGQVIVSNPMSAVPKPRVPRAEMRVWNRDQARRFLEATASDDLSPLYRLALSVGMRRGELLALRWRDVDLDAGFARVQHSLTDDGKLTEPKTRGSRRRVELPARAVAALRDQRKRLMTRGLRASPWVFPDESGGPLLARRVSRTFVAAVAAIDNLPRIRFHDLRHTCATLHLASGTHPKVASEMLGHASIQITLDLYSHVIEGLQREAADRFDAVL